MSYKSLRLDSFCNNGFQSVVMNAYSKTECRTHDPYLSLNFQMGRTYGSHDYFMLIFNGLKSVVTILAEATPLRPYTFDYICNFIFHSCENLTLNDIHYLIAKSAYIINVFC